MHPTTRKLSAAFLAASLPVGAAAPAVANPVKSLYTTLELSACRIVKTHEHGNAYACPGLDDAWPVWIAEGDDRTFVSYGPKPERRRAATQTLGAFNTPFTTKSSRAIIEWRFVRREGKSIPYATILRFHTSRGGARGDVLVVTRVTAEETCQVAWIDAFANSDAMATARRIADDAARRFDCRREPQVVGRKGHSPM